MPNNTYVNIDNIKHAALSIQTESWMLFCVFTKKDDKIVSRLVIDSGIKLLPIIKIIRDNFKVLMQTNFTIIVNEPSLQSNKIV